MSTSSEDSFVIVKSTPGLADANDAVDSEQLDSEHGRSSISSNLSQSGVFVSYLVSVSSSDDEPWLVRKESSLDNLLPSKKMDDTNRYEQGVSVNQRSENEHSHNDALDKVLKSLNIIKDDQAQTASDANTVDFNENSRHYTANSPVAFASSMEGVTSPKSSDPSQYSVFVSSLVSAPTDLQPWLILKEHRGDSENELNPDDELDVVLKSLNVIEEERLQTASAGKSESESRPLSTFSSIIPDNDSTQMVKQEVITVEVPHEAKIIEGESEKTEDELLPSDKMEEAISSRLSDPSQSSVFVSAPSLVSAPADVDQLWRLVEDNLLQAKNVDEADRNKPGISVNQGSENELSADDSLGVLLESLNIIKEGRLLTATTGKSEYSSKPQSTFLSTILDSGSTQKVKQEVITVEVYKTNVGKIIEGEPKETEDELLPFDKIGNISTSTMASELMDCQTKDQLCYEMLDGTAKASSTPHEISNDCSTLPDSTGSLLGLNQALPLHVTDECAKTAESLVWDDALDDAISFTEHETIARLEVENEQLQQALVDAEKQTYEQKLELTKALEAAQKQRDIERTTALAAVDELTKRVSDRESILKNQVQLIERLERRIKEKNRELEEMQKTHVEELARLRANPTATEELIASESIAIDQKAQKNEAIDAPDSASSNTSGGEEDQYYDCCGIYCPLCNECRKNWGELADHVELCVCGSQFDIM